MVKLLTIPWIKDALTEEDLGLSGLTYEFNPAVPYSAIDPRSPNRAREHSRLEEEVWADYALKMEAGSPFKAVTLYLVNDGVYQFGLAHGNHRFRAYAFAHNDNTKLLRSPKATLGAYVIQSHRTDDIEEYERLANSREGKRQSRDYAMTNAMWLVTNRKTTLKQAERRTGIKSEEISKAIRAGEIRSKVETLGVPTNHLTPSHLIRLSALKHDSHLKHIATIAEEGHMTSEDVSKMVSRVNKLTEAKGNAHIHDEYNRTRRERCGPSNGREPPELRKRRLFLKAFRNFEDIWFKGNDGRAVKSLSDVGIAPQDRQVREEMATRARDLITVMQNAMRLKGVKA